jgi:hypothetical protein
MGEQELSPLTAQQDARPGILLPDGRPVPSPKPRQTRFGHKAWRYVLGVVVAAVTSGIFWYDTDFGITVLLAELTVCLALLGMASAGGRALKFWFLSLSAVMVGLIFLQTYRSTLQARPKIMIKHSPALGILDRLRIQRDLWSFGDHLRDLGLKVDTPVPPIAVTGRRPGALIARRGRPGEETTVDVRESQIGILKSQIPDRMALLDGYSYWYLDQQMPPVLSRIDWNRMQDQTYLKRISEAADIQRGFVGVVARYLVDSYLGKKRPDVVRWDGALWEIRSRFGIEFADKLVAAMMAGMSTEASGPPELAFLHGADETAVLDLNLYRQISRAEDYLDSESGRLPALEEVLTRHGIKNPWQENVAKAPQRQ